MNPIIQRVDNARVFFGWIEHPAVTQHVVDDDQPALSGQLHATIVIVIVTRFIRVDKTEIERASDGSAIGTLLTSWTKFLGKYGTRLLSTRCRDNLFEPI
jgi:hypothetical protein